MLAEHSGFTLGQVRAFALEASNVGQLGSAVFAFAAANLSPQYRAPGVGSIEVIHPEIGHVDDAGGPLLTAASVRHLVSIVN